MDIILHYFVLGHLGTHQSDESISVICVFTWLSFISLHIPPSIHVLCTHHLFTNHLSSTSKIACLSTYLSNEIWPHIAQASLELGSVSTSLALRLGAWTTTPHFTKALNEVKSLSAFTVVFHTVIHNCLSFLFDQLFF